MKRLCGLLCVLFVCAGCATDGPEWDAFKKDLRGDNMQMRGDFGDGVRNVQDRPTQMQSGN